MNARILPPEEWSRLMGVDVAAPVLRYADPSQVTVVVVEDDAGKIVGCLPVLRISHLEGLWVRPGHRNGTALRTLLRAALEAVRGNGDSWALCGVCDGDDLMAGLLPRVGGFEVPARFYGMQSGGTKWAS
jgi:hypothetical protein